ncbi:hypothetical protein SAMN05192589_1373, partial [Paracidovorax valerianellae]
MPYKLIDFIGLGFWKARFCRGSLKRNSLKLTLMSKRIYLALSVALLTVMASSSRGHEQKGPPAQLALGHGAIYLIADAVTGTEGTFVTTAFVGVQRPDTLPGPAAGGIDNFGAGIRAGGLMRLSGGGLNNEQGRIEADSLLTSIQGDIANSRGTIVAHNGGYLQADGNIAATDGQFTSDAGKIVLDAGGSIVLDASQVKGKTGAGLYAGG